MSAGRRVASVLTVLALAVATVSSLGQLTSVDRTIDESVTDPPYRIRIESGSGDVTVRSTGEPDSGLRAQARVVGGWNEPDWTFHEENGWLVFSTECESSLLPAPCGGDWTFTVPGARLVDVEAGAGDVRLEGFFAGASVSTSAGDVDVVVPDDGTVYAVRGSSGAGDRTIDVPTQGAIERVLDLSTGAGDVTVTTAP